MPRLWIFDNDGTLYDDREIGSHFMGLLNSYVMKEFKIAAEEVKTFVEDWKQKWNTQFSIIAIMMEQGVTFDKLVSATYMHLPLELISMQPSDLERVSVIRELSGTKAVLTNNPAAYAQLVLERLGIASEFTHIIGMQEMGFILKPAPSAYTKALNILGDYEQIVFVDDRLENLIVPLQMGWKCIWYESDPSVEVPIGIIRISNLNELRGI